MANTDRGNFGSKIGVILATAGSAVGLGNIWRFPYVAGQNGGAAFIIINIICILLIGLPAMMSEFIVGRHAQANEARAFRMLSTGKPWSLIGYLGVFTGCLILCYYIVVAGWTMQYVWGALLDQVHGTKDEIQQYFVEFSENPWKPLVWMVIFQAITHFVIVKGASGIEKASKFMMPVLFILLLVLVGCSLSLPGASKGVEFLLKPDFSAVTKDTFIEALGQAFYSLSIGMGCLCTYASYFTKDTRLSRSAVQIAVIDTGVAILAGLLIFPAALSVGVQPDSGPSLIFITLPNVFQQAFSAVPALGYVVSLAFYLLLAIAALTSAISIHEVPTSFVSEEFHISRAKAATIVSVVTCLLGVLCSLSLGVGKETLVIFGKSVFDFFDWFSANICLTFSGLFVSLFIGWHLDHKIVKGEMTNWGNINTRFFKIFVVSAKYVCPAAIMVILLHQFGVI